MRSKPMILVALLLAAFLINLDTTLAERGASRARCASCMPPTI